MERAIVLTERDKCRTSLKHGVASDTSGGNVHCTMANEARTPLTERYNYKNVSKHDGENNKQLVNTYGGDGRGDGGHFFYDGG